MKAARFPGVIVVVAGALLAFGCRRGNHTERDQIKATTARSTTTASLSDTAAINGMVASIERDARIHPDHVELFARIPDHDSLIAVKDSRSWPESYDTTYNLWRDSVGRPIKYVAVPFSESGDEAIQISYWFDPDGRTIKYEYYEGSFNSGCTEVLRETKVVWLDHRGAPIAGTMRYTDKNKLPVHPDKCSRLADSVPAPRLRAADLAYPSGLAM